jgi:hypothetical protein
MIEIPSPVTPHRRLFFLLADRQRAGALFNRAMRSSYRRRTQAITNPAGDETPAIRLPNPPIARSILAATDRRRPPAILKSP